MTDQERITKLRDGTWDQTVVRGPNPTGFCSDETLFVQETADRIEEVVKERDELGRKLNTSRYGQPDFAWAIHEEAMADLRAKLTKAVETIKSLKAQWYIRDLQQSDFDAVLAELEGKK